MKYRGAVAIAVILAALLAAPCAAESKRPLVMLFETSRGERADKELAASTTRALRNYLRETQRVEAAIFDRESPTVLRAILENKLTADKVASYADQEARLAVAKELGFQYAAGAEISIRDVNVVMLSDSLLKTRPEEKPEGEKPAEEPKVKPDKNAAPTTTHVPPPVDESKNQTITQVEVKLWMARVGGGKNSKWEATGTAALGGTTSRDLDNTMQSAASSAVLEITRQGLAELPRVSAVSPSNGEESTAIGGGEPPTISKPSALEYAAKGDESLRGGDLAVAIEQYSKAVNADPGSHPLRIKLAEAYARKGMFTEAEEVLARAVENGASPNIVADARARIEKMNAPKPSQPDQPTQKEVVRPENRVSLSKGPSRTSPAGAKIIEGDKLWNAGNPDGASEAYMAAVKLDPSDWRAHERLALVDASMSLFGESRKVLVELSRVQPNPPPSIAANRYAYLQGYFDSYFKLLLGQYESTGADYEKRIITRESYYSVVKGLALRLESMAAFLDTLAPPQAKQASHLRKGIACGLMAQAASSLRDYLETNSAKSKSSAATFAAQAKSELAAAEKLDAPKAAPPPAPKPTPQPTTQPAPEPTAEPANEPAPEPEPEPSPDSYPAEQ